MNNTNFDNEAFQWLNENQLSYDIWNNKYRYDNETLEEWLDRVSNKDEDVKKLIREKKFLFGGRTLANRGIKDRGSYSNCYSIGYVPDSLDGIMDVASKIALTFKAQGGQGLSLSKIRPKGSLIRGQFQSDGIVPFMHIFNTVTESISQGGSRKGALMMSIDAEHPEALTFIKIKENPNEINKANLSVEISDDFMNSLETNEKNKEVFNTICESAWKSAEPGVLFTNQFRNYNLMEFVEDYQIETSNPCGEQPLPKNGACNLSSINISEYVINPFTKNATIDYISLGNDLKIIVKAMDDVLEENTERHALAEQREMSQKYRNVGIGIMGLADTFVRLGITYGSEQSIITASEIMKFIFRFSVISSADLSVIRGSFPGYSEKIWDSQIIKDTFDEKEHLMLKLNNGLRNCSLVSIAPTGSIGTMLNVSTGCEPFFALSYNRKTVSLNKEETIYKVDIKAVEDYKRITGNTELPNYFITSEEIYWKDRIKVQAALQQFTDTAISSTINLKKETTIDEVKELYKCAWKNKLKGVTIFRNGSRDPILSTKETQLDFPEYNKDPEELKRGDIIKSGSKWLGLKRTLNTGCGSLHCSGFFDPTNGELREIYLSKGSTGGCNHYMIGLSRMISLAARGGVKLKDILDQLKSCGTCPSYAVRSATKKDTSKGSCCPVAVGNALRDMSEEIKDIICHCNNDNVEEEIVAKTEEKINSLEECPSCHEKTLAHLGGCVQCNSCGFSKCS